MSVRDFKPLPNGVEFDSKEFQSWCRSVESALNIDDHLAVTSPASVDELDIFSVSNSERRKVTLANVLTLVPGSGWVKLDQVIANNQATVDFSSYFTATYDEYVVLITDFRAATAGGFLYARISEAGTFKTAANYRYANAASSASLVAVLADGSAGAGQMLISGNNAINPETIGSAATQALSGEFRLFGPSKTTTDKRMDWKLSFQSDGAGVGFVSIVGGGTYADGQAAVDGLRFLSSAGNTTSGTFTLWGIPK